MIGIDQGPEDCLYRIRRKSEGDVARVVHVTIDTGIIPDGQSTYGRSVIKHLSTLDGWDRNDWTTITVRKLPSDQIVCETDIYPPHGLPKEFILFEMYPMISLFDLQDAWYMSARVFRVVHAGQSCFFKFAEFGYEMCYLRQEVKVYHLLMAKDSPVSPKLLGYVYEETSDRTIGFLMEAIEGRFAGPGDLEACSQALDSLHQLGVVHNNFRKYNCLITAAGAKLIDFESSIILKGQGEAEWDGLLKAEKQLVKERLNDASKAGRPLGILES